MSIPDEAVEAAAQAAFLAGYVRRVAVPDPAIAAQAWLDRDDAGREPYRIRAREYLEAGAPFIAAQALRDRAQTIKDTAPADGLRHVDDVVEDIRDMADFLEARP